MQKRGKTAAGTQRWLCLPCSRSHSLGHETQARGRLLDRFVAWLLGKQSQAELSRTTERSMAPITLDTESHELSNLMRAVTIRDSV